MSEVDLQTLEEAAAQARQTANDLQAALTDESSDEERAQAQEAEDVAVKAESAYAEAKAAEADAGAGTHEGGDAEPEQHVGDACECPDGRPGTLHLGAEEGTFVCIPNQG